MLKANRVCIVCTTNDGLCVWDAAADMYVVWVGEYLGWRWCRRWWWQRRRANCTQYSPLPSLQPVFVPNYFLSSLYILRNIKHPASHSRGWTYYIIVICVLLVSQRCMLCLGNAARRRVPHKYCTTLKYIVQCNTHSITICIVRYIHVLLSLKLVRDVLYVLYDDVWYFIYTKYITLILYT